MHVVNGVSDISATPLVRLEIVYIRRPCQELSDVNTSAYDMW